MVSTGIGKLQGLDLLPASSMLWDTSFLLSDRSLAGIFLNGLVGYRAQPSSLEAGGYVAYLLLGGLLLFGERLKASPPPPADPADRLNLASGQESDRIVEGMIEGGHLERPRGAVISRRASRRSRTLSGGSPR